MHSSQQHARHLHYELRFTVALVTMADRMKNHNGALLSKSMPGQSSRNYGKEMLTLLISASETQVICGGSSSLSKS